MNSIKYNATRVVLWAIFMLSTYNASAAVFYIQNNSDWDVAIKLDDQPATTIKAHNKISIGDPIATLSNILEMTVTRVGSAQFLSRTVSIDVEPLKTRSWIALEKQISVLPGQQRNLYWNITSTGISWDVQPLVVAQKPE